MQNYSELSGVIKIQLYGDWEYARRAWKGLSNFQNPIVKDAARGVRDFAEKYKRLLILGVTTQGAAVGQNWPDHSARYAEWKASRFTESGFLKASGTYLSELEKLAVVQKKYYVELKFRRGAKNRKAWSKGITMGKYMIINENGLASRNIRPRPLWGPAYQKLGGHKGVIKSVLNRVRGRLNKYGIRIAANI